VKHAFPVGKAVAVGEIESKVDLAHLEETLMAEGIKKFADPQKALLALVAERRRKLRAKAG